MLDRFFERIDVTQPTASHHTLYQSIFHPFNTAHLLGAVSTITQQQLTDIIRRVNVKHKAAYLTAMNALLLGTHARVGAASSILTFITSPRFDRHLLPLIFSFLFRALPSTLDEAVAHRAAHHLPAYQPILCRSFMLHLWRGEYDTGTRSCVATDHVR